MTTPPSARSTDGSLALSGSSIHTSRHVARGLAALVALAVPVLGQGCTRTPPTDRGASGSASAAVSAAPSAAASGSSGVEMSTADDQVKPVYPLLKGDPHPVAVRLCAAVQGLPARRRAECCSRAAAPGVESECLRNVSGALTLGGVTVDEAALARCEEAVKTSLAGCDWVAPFPMAPPPPPACLGLFKGTLAAGAVCRSSLECKDGAQCAGAGPTTTGRCVAARDQGPCGPSVDVLAVNARQDDVEKTHPACTGFCDRHQCAPLRKDGEACLYNAPCGPGHHCNDRNVCQPGEAGHEGEACLGLRCDPGLRCDQGKCVAPRRENEPCERDAQCRASCVQGPGEKDGKRCASKCSLGGSIPTGSGGRTFPLVPLKK